MHLNVGEHLWVKRNLYTHHGIYIGNNEVVHYSGLANGLQSGPVCKTSLYDFANGVKINKKTYKDAKYHTTEVVNRVEQRMGEHLYSVHSNNCEHFCNWAITGQHTSNQVEIIETVVGYISPLGEIVSNLKTLRQGFKIKDNEVIKSSSVKTAKIVGEKVAIGAIATIAVPVVAPILGIGILATKLYKKVKN